jgi:DNA-binding NtrC family response regulator
MTAQAHSELNSKAGKKKILLVNNDPQMGGALRNLLQLGGHTVVLAATGQEGVRKFCDHHFDLLLLDVNLPDTSGWNIFKMLTSVNPFLPIVVTGRNGQREPAVLDGQIHLADLQDVPRLMHTLAQPPRQTVGKATPLPRQPAQKCGLGATGAIEILRVT